MRKSEKGISLAIFDWQAVGRYLKASSSRNYLQLVAHTRIPHRTVAIATRRRRNRSRAGRTRIHTAAVADAHTHTHTHCIAAFLMLICRQIWWRKRMLIHLIIIDFYSMRYAQLPPISIREANVRQYRHEQLLDNILSYILLHRVVENNAFWFFFFALGSWMSCNYHINKHTSNEKKNRRSVKRYWNNNNKFNLTVCINS